MLRIIAVLGLLAGSASGALGQEKMLANYAAMPDLRCAGGFLAADGFWTADENASLEREERWVRISAIHDVFPVKGVRAGPDEPGYRVTAAFSGIAQAGGRGSLGGGAGSPPVQYKVHLLQKSETFLEFLARCERDGGAHGLARLAPEMAAP